MIAPFFPFKDVGGAPAATSGAAPAQQVDLARALFVLRATFFDPVSEAQKPLPRHVFALQTRPDVTVYGTGSDPRGVSAISASPRFVEMPDASWSLCLYPYPARPTERRAVLEAYGAQGECWVDLDRGEWVVPGTIGALERRRLLRLPKWSSALQASRGGFAQVPPQAASFAAKGAIRSAEMTPFGTASSPWSIEVDHGMYRSYVDYRFYDWQRKKTISVPGGLVLEARDKDGLRVGAGTSLGVDSPFYLLHERPKERSKDAHYAFATDAAKPTYVDLTKAAPATGGAPSSDDRMQVATDSSASEPKVRRSRYVLPRAWHSLGHEARVGGGARRAYADVQGSVPDLSKGSPLVFHLDDTVLTTSSGIKQVGKGERVTLFDHVMKIRDPDEEHPHSWKQRVNGPFLRGEEAIVAEGKGLAECTLVIHHEGGFHVLRTEHVMGTPGRDALVGARAARSHYSLHTDYTQGSPYAPVGGSFELVLIPDAINGTEFYDGATEVEVSHLVAYVPIRLKADGVTNEDLRYVEGQLIAAAARWDQKHPSNPGVPGKDYWIVPTKGVSAGSRVVKVRHFFAPRADEEAAFLVNVRPGHGLTSTTPGRRFMELYMEDAQPDGEPAHDTDGVDEATFNLAHEMGHVLGLPDEYPNLLKNKLPANESQETNSHALGLLRFKQNESGKPYLRDQTGMMSLANLPRLRYIWPYAAYLNQSTGPTPLSVDAPFLPTYRTYGRGLRYQVATGKCTPWDLVVPPRRLDSNRGDLLLYRCGEDEAIAERLFGNLAPGERPDGLLIIRTKLWWSFPVDAWKKGSLTQQWSVLTGYAERALLLPASIPRFTILAAGALPLARIGILYQPCYEFAPNPPDPDSTAETAADVILRVYPDEPDIPYPTNLLDPSALHLSPPEVKIGSSHATRAITRYVLGITPFVAPQPGEKPKSLAAGELGPEELSGIARQVSFMLADPAGSPPRRVVSVT